MVCGTVARECEVVPVALCMRAFPKDPRLAYTAGLDRVSGLQSSHSEGLAYQERLVNLS